MRLRLVHAHIAVDVDGRQWDKGSDGIWRRGQEAVERLSVARASRASIRRKPALVVHTTTQG